MATETEHIPPEMEALQQEYARRIGGVLKDIIVADIMQKRPYANVALINALATHWITAVKLMNAAGNLQPDAIDKVLLRIERALRDIHVH